MAALAFITKTGTSDVVYPILHSRSPRQHPEPISDAAATASISPAPRPVLAPVVDISSNDYLFFSTSLLLRARVLAALDSSPAILDLGSGDFRLLVYNHVHAALEVRLPRTFRSPPALLFTSGFDAKVGFFACVAQPNSAFLHDEAIHAFIHDDARASRIAACIRRSFAHNNDVRALHNDVRALRTALRTLRDEYVSLREGKSSVVIAVESVYSTDGTSAPLRAILDTMKDVFTTRAGGLRACPAAHVRQGAGSVRWCVPLHANMIFR